MIIMQTFLCPSFKPFNYPHLSRLANKREQIEATDGIAISLDGADITGSWIDQELSRCRFSDKRLGDRFGVLMQRLSGVIGRTIPLACGDWANTNTVYLRIQTSSGKGVAGCGGDRCSGLFFL